MPAFSPTAGIIAYGTALPNMRIRLQAIAEAQQKDAQEMEKKLGIREKSVAAADEDTATLAIAASYEALEKTKLSPHSIGAIYVGSESHPYAVKPTATIVGNALNVGTDYFAADIEFACKAGSAALQITAGFVLSGQAEYGLAIGSDVAQSASGDMLEYTAAAGAAAFILGHKKEEMIATLQGMGSYHSDTPDFWRPRGAAHPEHSGRFTGEPGYFAHVSNAVKNFLLTQKDKIADFDHVIFHTPNGVFPKKIGKELGVKPEQLKYCLQVAELGNAYTASVLLSLANVLDHAKPGERILLASYGSGAGSDVLTFTVTKNIEKYPRTHSLAAAQKKRQYISYPEYLSLQKQR